MLQVRQRLIIFYSTTENENENGQSNPHNTRVGDDTILLLPTGHRIRRAASSGATFSGTRSK